MRYAGDISAVYFRANHQLFCVSLTSQKWPLHTLLLGFCDMLSQVFRITTLKIWAVTTNTVNLSL